MGGTFNFPNETFRFSHVSSRFALALAHQQLIISLVWAWPRVEDVHALSFVDRYLTLLPVFLITYAGLRITFRVCTGPKYTVNGLKYPDTQLNTSHRQPTLAGHSSRE